MLGFTGIYSEGQSSPALVNFVRVQLEKFFLRRRFSVVRTAAHRKTRNTQKRMLLRKSTFVTVCGTVNVCARACALQDV
jgi:hypothetical protein